MAPDKIKTDENTEIEVSRVPSKNPEAHNELDVKSNPEAESPEEKSVRDRSQGNETMGIP
ncbi:hypothetical protein [Flavobacterium sp. 3HN19-14]|uniref:hypothetical protein n=1 Tax=Flavobacterium sp. 3HN19-14 TaxID=3448133 RepID=UPI003EDFD8B2